MNTNTIIGYLKIGVLMILIIAGGMLAVNQALGYYYKSQLLQSPCGLCISLNPNFTRCQVSQIQNLQNEFSGFDWDTLNISIEK